jgi:hypothetical protein
MSLIGREWVNTRTDPGGVDAPRQDAGGAARRDEGGEVAANMAPLAFLQVQQQRPQTRGVRVTTVDDARGEVVRGGALLVLEVGGGQQTTGRDVIHDHDEQVGAGVQDLSRALHLRDVAVVLERPHAQPCLH